jgi:ABC-2 type transport system ATP-binding protein
MAIVHMSEPALRADSVVKQFASVRAVDGLSFAVERGQIFALLGPNGAGKTTTLRMLLGILRPDSGEIRYALDGVVAWPPASRLGYLPEERGLFREAPVARTVAYFGILRGMDRGAANVAAAAWLKRLGLADRAHERPDALSKGNQQKVQLAAALVHRPSVAILDEPFSGLDPLNQELFLDLLRELRNEGAAVVLSAHQMQLVERVADRILVMDHGREALSGTLDDLRRRMSVAGRLSLKVRLPADPARIASHPGVAAVAPGRDGELIVDVVAGARLSEVLAAAAGAYEVLGVSSEEASLHDIYLQAVGGSSHEEARK